MSLRDFDQANERPISLQNEPMGNGSGLGTFHTVNPEDVAPSNTPKILGALAVALMVGAAGIGVYSYSGSPAKPVTVASNQPASAPAAPPPVAPPPAEQQAAMTPDANASANTPAAAPAPAAPEKTVKTKTASAKPARSTESASSASALPGGASARMAADSSQINQQPQQQQAAVPQPVSPTASPSDVATTNTQSGVAVPQGATQAQDMPAPQPATPAAPAPSQQPAPAQTAGQANQ
jgi:hypothetical protein